MSGDKVSESEIEVTPEMIEAGLEWLYAYNPDSTDGRDIVREIIRAALAKYISAGSRRWSNDCDPQA